MRVRDEAYSACSSRRSLSNATRHSPRRECYRAGWQGRQRLDGRSLTPSYECPLIVGAGDGLSASLARHCAANGLRVGPDARHIDELSRLPREIGAATHPADASRPEDVEALFVPLDRALGAHKYEG
jgi:hypothetical protein